MEALWSIELWSRWIHVGTAIVVVGGTVFLRFVLMPAAAELPEAEHEAFRQRLMRTWRKFVGIGIGLFLLTGFYNYIAVTMPQHRGDGLYHALVGTKIILAVVVFLLASALTGRSPAFEGVRRSSKKWMSVTILLAAVIVAISSFVKVRGPATPPPDPAEQRSEL